MTPSITALQARALEDEFIALAQEIAHENAHRAPDLVDPDRLPAPCKLIMRSGVAADNDQEIGQFSCPATAKLCGRFLMSLDRIYQPEYSHFEVQRTAVEASLDLPKPGLYRHYKGNLYQVIEIARHSETLEPLVVYRALHGEGGSWVRPAGMFQEFIDINGQQVPRFAHMEDSLG